MEMDTNQAKESLRIVDQAQETADRYSQNNGTVLLVWGLTVFLGLSGFDIAPRIAAQINPHWGPNDAGPIAAALFLIPIALSASLWTRAYVRRLPIQPISPGNPWLYVQQGDGKLSCGGGWWWMYHIAVLFGGIGIGSIVAQQMHRGIVPGTFTIIGLIDAAPLLITGWKQHRRVQTTGRAA